VFLEEKKNERKKKQPFTCIEGKGKLLHKMIKCIRGKRNVEGEVVHIEE